MNSISIHVVLKTEGYFDDKRARAYICLKQYRMVVKEYNTSREG